MLKPKFCWSFTERNFTPLACQRTGDFLSPTTISSCSFSSENLKMASVGSKIEVIMINDFVKSVRIYELKTKKFRHPIMPFANAANRDKNNGSHRIAYPYTFRG